MGNDFFAYLYRLRYIERWSLMRNTVRENVAEHSYHVAILTHLLCNIAQEIFGREVAVDRAVSIALFHDVTEVFTGDIPTPVKHHNPDILSSFRQIERMAGDKLHGMVPKELQAVYKPLLTYPNRTVEPNNDSKPSAIDAYDEETSELRRYVKAADLLDAYIKCMTELSAGNREFGPAKKQIEQSIAKLDMPEVNYFLTHLAPSLEKTLDELAE
jgi:5'-deoxynucleotidase